MASETTQAQVQPGDVRGSGSVDLVVGAEISGGVQQVLDQQNNASALYVGESFVGAGAPSGYFPTVVLQAQGSVASTPLFAIHNANATSSPAPEASIHFSNASDGGKLWHVGVGGGGGPMNFFFWNSVEGNVVMSLDPTGNLTLAGKLVNTSIDAGSVTVTNLPSVLSAPPETATLATLAVDTSTGKLYAV